MLRKWRRRANERGEAHVFPGMMGPATCPTAISITCVRNVSGNTDSLPAEAGNEKETGAVCERDYSRDELTEGS